MYIFATLRGGNGAENSRLFDGWRSYYNATFSPEIDTTALHPLEIHGKTYHERQNSLRELAIDIQNADTGGMSYGEYAELGAFFDRHARKLGLLREFRENAVC